MNYRSSDHKRETNKQRYWDNRDKLLSDMRVYYSKNRSKYRDRQFLKKYHLTAEDYDQKMEAQGFRCAICKVPFADDSRQPNSPRMDHDHQSGANRDFLCNLCNTAIGFFNEDVLRMEAAIAYLVKHTKRW